MKSSSKTIKDVAGSLSLTYNNLYTGVVERVDNANRQVLVAVEGSSSLVNCVYAGGIFSSMFGLQTKFLPQKKTNVAILYGRTSFILACLPSIGGDSASGDSEVMLGTLPDKIPFCTQDTEDTGKFVQPQAIDLLEGELDLTNAFSVGIRLLTTVASLDAGGRAKVEALLLDDMVRIVSENFKHYSAFGNYEIYNDGRLNVRFDGTSYPHEAYGVPMDQERITMKGYEADLKKIKAETGRWRFSEYVGFLGDFITKIIADPTTALGAFSESNLRAGRSRIHQNTDGTILMQSVSDIVLERVCRIPVPVEISSPKTIEVDFKNLEKQYLKLWEYGDTEESMAHVSFQLREYARWLSNYHAYARFHQLKESWKVPTEGESPAPDPSCGEADKAFVRSSDTIVDTYATVRIMRDGSIVILNGLGSSVVMAGKDTYVSSAKDLILEAAGDVIVTAGNNIHMKAGDNITITATFGKLVTKARTLWSALCERGSVWLKSDKEEDLNDGLGMSGVLIDTPSSDIRNETGTTYEVLATSAESKIRLLSADKVDIQSNGDTNVSAQKHMTLRGLSSISMPTALLESSAYSINFGGSFSISGGRVAATVFSAEVLQGKQAIQGPRRPGGIDGHLNHIDVYNSSIYTAQGLSAPSQEEFYPVLSPLQDRMWQYTEDKYKSAEGKCETYAQQYARINFQESYAELDVEQEGLMPGKFTRANSRPWPGIGAMLYKHSGGEDLTEPSNSGYNEVKTKATDFNSQAYTFKYWLVEGD